MALTKIGKEGITGISNASDATAITIDSSERVMIGTTTEGDVNGDDLTIATTGATGITVRSGTSSDGHLFFSDGTSGADEYRGYLQYNHQNDRLSFGTNAVERMRLFSAGDITFGCTALPSDSVGGAGFESASSSRMILKLASTTTSLTNLALFYNPNGNVGGIKTDGSATNFATSSDYRLKENVSYNFDATTRLKQLKPCRFNFIADADTTVDGFIAHEVSSIVPEAITGEKDAVDADGNIDPQGIDQSKLVPLLVKTIQELEARITALESA